MMIRYINQRFIYLFTYLQFALLLFAGVS